MRFHTGLGVGHVYAHERATPDHPSAEEPQEVVVDQQLYVHHQQVILESGTCEDAEEASNEGLDSDVGEGSSTGESSDEEGHTGGDSEGSDTSEMDDEELLAMDDMYW